jgi:hypothetical protein
MNTNKPRNRERRTKPNTAGNCISIQIRLPRDTYDQVKDMERRKQHTKEEIFLLGLQACVDH